MITRYQIPGFAQSAKDALKLEQFAIMMERRPEIISALIMQVINQLTLAETAPAMDLNTYTLYEVFNGDKAGKIPLIMELPFIEISDVLASIIHESQFNFTKGMFRVVADYVFVIPDLNIVTAAWINAPHCHGCRISP